MLSAEAYSSAPSPERTLVDDDTMDNSPDTDGQLFCFCRDESYEMIACEGFKDCPYEWFHLECVGIRLKQREVERACKFIATVDGTRGDWRTPRPIWSLPGVACTAYA
ncbi:hypothetical protein BJ742DRAFT_799970 [Cladochytrium replicatum]|nr:hypothetical protein BJ742DRAFT_799970 [Cladochytrium replicatum]